eukprot:2950876-Prymnesium_polylepis.2
MGASAAPAAEAQRLAAQPAAPVPGWRSWRSDRPAHWPWRRWPRLGSLGLWRLPRRRDTIITPRLRRHRGAPAPAGAPAPTARGILPRLPVLG